MNHIVHDITLVYQFHLRNLDYVFFLAREVGLHKIEVAR